MTIKDIARMSGYGIGTVSRVINNQPGVSDAARTKILKVVEESGFDGIEMAGYSIPRLTTVRQDTEVIVARSVDIILEKIHNMTVCGTHEMVAQILVEGESVKSID